MAVETQDTHPLSKASSGRRLLVGTNVLVAIVLVVAIVTVAQLIAYKAHVRVDMTSSGVNSVSEGTENLLRNLDQNVRLTSLYFETDREDEDQPRYRQAARDLIDLYQATNRAKVRAEWVNPLKDHEKYNELIARLRDKASFAGELDDYKAKVDKYTGELDERLRALVQAELEQIGGAGASIGGAGGSASIAQVESALGDVRDILTQTREKVDALTIADNPQYTAAVNVIRSFYRQLSQTFKNIGQFGTREAMQDPSLAPAQVQFLQGANGRYADIVATLEAQTTELQDLEPPKYDDLLAQLGETSNAMLVETDADARVVDFGTVWPPVQEGRPGGGFETRAFKGEEKLTSAILRATHKEQTAVVFVRYGGAPPFMGAMMFGQRPGPYVTMKLQLEDANFIVEDWDLKTSVTPPVIDPKPTRTIYVILKPTPPQRGPMGQPSQEPPFADTHKQAILSAIGAGGRALFIAGWHPGPFGPMPDRYEFGEYLNDEWGINVDTSALLVETVNIRPGEYVVGRQDFFSMRDLSVTSHDIVSGALARELGMPLCAPVELAATPPEGVEHHRLVYLESRDGVWGETNLAQFLEQARSQDPLSLENEDPKGPFDLAVAATKGDSKVVVVSSAQFAVDQVAFARGFAMTSRGLTIRSLNPGNASLLINSLHWLNDNTEFMNIGKPIEAAVLEIGSESTVKVVQAVTIFGWPLLALVCGGMVWWVRRR